MCKNAMLYNAPDTIYYKSAEKLLNLGVSALTGVSVACSFIVSIGLESLQNL